MRYLLINKYNLVYIVFTVQLVVIVNKEMKCI